MNKKLFDLITDILILSAMVTALYIGVYAVGVVLKVLGV